VTTHRLPSSLSPQPVLGGFGPQIGTQRPSYPLVPWDSCICMRKVPPRPRVPFTRALQYCFHSTLPCRLRVLLRHMRFPCRSPQSIVQSRGANFQPAQGGLGQMSQVNGEGYSESHPGSQCSRRMGACWRPLFRSSLHRAPKKAASERWQRR